MDALIGGAVALAAVALTAWLTRSHERRTWKRNQMVDACTEFLAASAAVEQWSAPRWAARLKQGQHPTEFKLDNQRLEAAIARLRLVAPPQLCETADQAVDALKQYLKASTDGAAPIELLPRMLPMMSGEQAQAWDRREAAKRDQRAARQADADEMRDRWNDEQIQFIQAARKAVRKGWFA